MGRSIDPRSCVPGRSQVDLPLLHASETAEEGRILQRGSLAGRQPGWKDKPPSSCP